MLNKKLIEKVIIKALSTGADFAEVFIEDKFATNLSMISSKVEKVNNSKVFGVGIRVALGYNSVYGYTNDVSEEDLMNLASDLSMSFNEENKIQFKGLNDIQVGELHRVKILPHEVKMEDKVNIMKKADLSARSFSEEISQVSIYYLDYVQNVWIANSEGTYIQDQRVRTRTGINAIASNGNEKQSGFYGPGGSYGFEFYSDIVNIEEAAKEAARIAVTMLHADECPSGEMPVVIDNGFGGVIFHEACGHSLEASSVAKGASVFCGKKGQLIANPLVNAIDDGTIANAWGSSTFDDEGNRQSKRELIKNGVLTSYMIDKLNAIRMNDEHTNSGRRESYKFSPTSRMSNTFIDNGDSTFDEIIAATKYGLYAKKMGGGSVNPATGDFNFAVGEGYLIRDGKIAEPVRGATLVGTGKDALLKIDMIANNLKTDQGMCGSSSGSIPADVGQPTIRVSSMTVGGRKGAN